MSVHLTEIKIAHVAYCLLREQNFAVLMTTCPRDRLRRNRNAEKYRVRDEIHASVFLQMYSDRSQVGQPCTLGAYSNTRIPHCFATSGCHSKYAIAIQILVAPADGKHPWNSAGSLSSAQ